MDEIKTIKNLEQEALDKFASRVWTISFEIGRHIDALHPIWMEGESERRRKALLIVREQLENARSIMLNLTRDDSLRRPNY